MELTRFQVALVGAPLMLPFPAFANAMWSAGGYSWSCSYSQAIICERAADCVQQPQRGRIEILYEKSNVIVDGTTISIRRHFDQAVPQSPLGREVKIELEDNQVLWLVPADASGVFSNNWIGTLTTPKAGVVIAEMRPLVCLPKF
ncbi:MAG: hypothetical protein Pars93KO_28200 [Parasphingorhabdus sp.]